MATGGYELVEVELEEARARYRGGRGRARRRRRHPGPGGEGGRVVLLGAPRRTMKWEKLAVPLIVAGILGGIEMRVAVARLETTGQAVEKRVERLEHLAGSRSAQSYE